MAVQSYATLLAANTAWNDAARQAFLTLISGQNIDGTAFTLPVSGTVTATSGGILYPSVAGNTAGTAITATSGVVSAATATCTLTGTAGKFTWLTGFVVTGDGATAASAVTMTVAGVVTGTQSYAIGVPSALATLNLPVTLPVPVPSSAVNTNIVLTLPSLGTGNTGASVNAFGFLL